MRKITILSLFVLFSAFSFGQTDSSPNVVVILADDMGFSDLGCYGAEIQTPALDNLARNGIKFRRFYNTAKCSPSRAALLTGQYPHAAGMENLTTSSNGNSPAYLGYISPNTVTLAEVFKSAGYKTYMSGKWHVGENQSHWPRQRGFDRYWGLISGANSYYELLTQNGRQMALDDTPWNPDSDYTEALRTQHGRDDFYMSDATADFAIDFIEDGGSAQPFFLYMSFTAPHWPLHAPEESIQAYDGVYDQGWNTIANNRLQKMKQLGILDANVQLSPRDGRNWNSIPDSDGDQDIDQDKGDMARRMQAYAAQVTKMDEAIGKLVDHLRANGELDNTIIMFVSDNGGSDEDVEGRNNHVANTVVGAEGSYMSYLREWANASNTPFRKYKNDTEEGGIATPMIVHWPDGIAGTNQITEQVGHLKDVMPTLLDVTGASYPTNYGGNSILPLAGKSFANLFSDANNVEEQEIFWEYNGNRAVRFGNWKMVSTSANGSWSLYDMEADPTELNDLASSFPGVVSTLSDRYELWETSVGHQSGSLPNPSLAPTVANQIPDQGAAPDEIFDFIFQSATFGDEPNDILLFTATLADGSALPNWLAFDGFSRRFNGVPSASDLANPVTVKVTAKDWAGNTVSDEFAIAEENIEPFSGCPELSTLPCSDIALEMAELPFVLNFEGTSGGVEDGFGVGTGFTMIDPPSAPLTTPSNQNVPGYEPSLLTVSDGSLKLATRNGIAFRDPSQSDDTNSQVNTLGVGIEGISQVVNIEVEMLDVPIGSGNSEQAGLWFGLDEDNFVKFNLVSAGPGPRMALRSEVNAISENSDQLVADIAETTINSLKMRLQVDPVAETIEGFYALNGASEISIGSLPLPYNFISGTDRGSALSGNTVFMGIFGTHRNGASSLNYTFDSFNIAEVTGNQDPFVENAPDPVFFAVGEAINYIFPETIFNDNEDGRDLSFSAQLVVEGTPGTLPDWLTFDAQSRTFSSLEGTSVSGVYTILLTATDTQGASVATDFVLTVSEEGFSLIEEFDYGEGSLATVSDWVPGGGNNGTADVISANLLLSDRTSNGKGVQLKSTNQGNAAFNYNPGTDGNNYFDTPYPIQVNVPFYYGLDFRTDDIADLAGGDGIRSFMEFDNSETVRVRVLNLSGQLTVGVALGGGGSSPLDFVEDVNVSEGNQLVVRGIWNGNQIAYSAVINPQLDINSVNWQTVGTQNATDPILFFNRLFVGTTGEQEGNEGTFHAIRVGTEYSEIVKLGNNPPFLTGNLDDVGPFVAEEAFDFFVNAVFEDVDAGDNLTYSASLSDDSALPNWLDYNSSNNSFGALAGQSVEGSYSIKITATDQGSESVSATFDLAISQKTDNAEIIYREVFGNNNPILHNGNPEPLATEINANWVGHYGPDANKVILFERTDPAPKLALSGFDGKPSTLDNVNADVTLSPEDGFLFGNINEAPLLAFTEEYAINPNAFENIEF
ncbi:MAG: sulfatase-like hydrolase/transferase, partial [Pricia sp.]